MSQETESKVAVQQARNGQLIPKSAKDRGVEKKKKQAEEPLYLARM
ncbi:MAG: hypothetical protein NWF00_02145 [Candidatus Bathyarchaeota archaeon]|nr:hypothetical protein [Candidatus Bathyarchaeota archaeon]